MKQSLHYQAAKLAMGKLNADDIKSTIHRLVDEGIYLDEFHDALDERQSRMDEVLPALLAAFRHEGIVLPDREQAVWQLIEFHLQRIAYGAENPLEELGKLIADVYWNYDFHTPMKKYLGDSHGIEALIGLYWGADELTERPKDISFNGKYGEVAWSELKREIVIESKKWLADKQQVR